MKYIVLLSLVFTFFQSANGSRLETVYSDSSVFKRPQHVKPSLKDDYVPIPFGGELPFPWSISQGVWFVRNSIFESYFVFKVIPNTPNSKPKLYIEQFDSKNCSKLAFGTADEYSEGGKVLWAMMRTQPRFAPYRLGVRAFRSTSFPKDLNVPVVNGQVLVVTMSSLSNSADSFHVLAQKVAGKPDIQGLTQCRLRGAIRF